MSQPGALFDFDGVIIDSSPFHLASWRKLGEQVGFHMTDELFVRTFGMTNPAILPMLIDRPLSPEEVQELSERKEVLYRELAAGQLKPLPGVVSLLHSLRAAGFRVALGSSAPRSNITALLGNLGIEELFDATISGNDVSHGKPHPEVFLKAAAAVGVEPARSVVVEDAIVGIQAAKAAGSRCLAVTTTHAREKLSLADRVVDSLAEVDATDFLAILGER